MHMYIKCHFLLEKLYNLILTIETTFFFFPKVISPQIFCSRIYKKYAPISAYANIGKKVSGKKNQFETRQYKTVVYDKRNRLVYITLYWYML